MNRYHRQILLPQIGPDAQSTLARSRAVLIGCGALGCAVADQLVRAGLGHLRILDRDIVEGTNLQRQILFDESDARQGLPKAMAAANRLRAINSDVTTEPVVVDLHAANAEELIGSDLILDGTDNAETRYLLNDVAVKHGISWVYGACVGTEGRMMAVRPRRVGDTAGETPLPLSRYAGGGSGWGPLVGGSSLETGSDMGAAAPPPQPSPGVPGEGECRAREAPAGVFQAQPGPTPCLRCLFPTPPAPGSLPTCDTTGILGPIASIVGSLQAIAAIQLLIGAEVPNQLLSFDGWSGRWHAVPLEGPHDGCPACGERRFEFLAQRKRAPVALCGRNAVQVQPIAGGEAFRLDQVAEKLRGVGHVEQTPYLLRCAIQDASDIRLTLFADGRMIVHGTSDFERARSIYARYIGV